MKPTSKIPDNNSTFTKKYWFVNKKVGFGWKPTGTKGWSVMFVYFACLLGGAYIAGELYEPEKYMHLAVALTVLLLVVIVRTGEPLHWRWKDIKKKQ